jgi:pimeloyl-ACP methyl ester carboxylesterase
MMNVYLISGLGADSRAFFNLTFHPSLNIIHLNWIEATKNESLEAYALRLAKVIDTSTPFYLIGLSLGGMIATEIAKVLQPVKTILISSVCCYTELPIWYRIGGNLQLHKLIPGMVEHKANMFLYWLFSLTQQHDKNVLKQVMADSDLHFTKWAINAVTKWRNLQIPENLIRIHGNKDRVLPITSFKPDYVIQGGGHLMVANRAKDISAILNNELLE